VAPADHSGIEQHRVDGQRLSVVVGAKAEADVRSRARTAGVAQHVGNRYPAERSIRLLVRLRHLLSQRLFSCAH
jgi:hypothetical protein